MKKTTLLTIAKLVLFIAIVAGIQQTEAQGWQFVMLIATLASMEYFMGYYDGKSSVKPKRIRVYTAWKEYAAAAERGERDIEFKNFQGESLTTEQVTSVLEKVFKNGEDA